MIPRHINAKPTERFFNRPQPPIPVEARIPPEQVHDDDGPAPEGAVALPVAGGAQGLPNGDIPGRELQKVLRQMEDLDPLDMYLGWDQILGRDLGPDYENVVPLPEEHRWKGVTRFNGFWFITLFMAREVGGYLLRSISSRMSLLTQAWKISNYDGSFKRIGGWPWRRRFALTAGGEIYAHCWVRHNIKINMMHAWVDKTACELSKGDTFIIARNLVAISDISIHRKNAAWIEIFVSELWLSSHDERLSYGFGFCTMKAYTCNGGWNWK